MPNAKGPGISNIPPANRGNGPSAAAPNSRADRRCQLATTRARSCTSPASCKVSGSGPPPLLATSRIAACA
eukprot:4297293-Alexandrium_andersonii.AAC.1